MHSPYCTRSHYNEENDKDDFVQGYVAWKVKQYKSPCIFDRVDQEAGAQHHPVLDHPDIMSQVFTRLGREDKRNMTVVSRQWAKWFSVGIETSKVMVDYKQQLSHENNDGLITIRRENILAKMYCICQTYATEKEKRKYHRKRARAQSRKHRKKLCHMQQHEQSGDEGYYDSDC